MALLPSVTLPMSPVRDEMDLHVMRQALHPVAPMTPPRATRAFAPGSPATGRTCDSTPDACLPPLMDDDEDVEVVMPTALFQSLSVAMQPQDLMPQQLQLQPQQQQQQQHHLREVTHTPCSSASSHSVSPAPAEATPKLQARAAIPLQPMPVNHLGVPQQGAKSLGVAQASPPQQQQQQQQQARPAKDGGKVVPLPRESHVCADQLSGTLIYAAPRGTPLRVSWRNKLWSNAALLRVRFGDSLSNYFRENYADRSPASEPLLHNNYPSGSRVYFQGRVTAAHCVCHHLVQIFEAFALTPGGRPDPVGLQALWIAPVQVPGRVFGYAKFVEPRMAASAVVGIRGQWGNWVHNRDQGAVPSESSIQVLEQLGRCMQPPLLPQETSGGYGGWSARALAVLRVSHAMSVRFHLHCGGMPAPAKQLVGNALADLETAARATFGAGTMTQAAVDAQVLGCPCPYSPYQAAPQEAAVLEDISLANEQRPGHRGQPREPSATPSGGAQAPVALAAPAACNALQQQQPASLQQHQGMSVVSPMQQQQQQAVQQQQQQMVQVRHMQAPGLMVHPHSAKPQQHPGMGAFGMGMGAMLR